MVNAAHSHAKGAAKLRRDSAKTTLRAEAVKKVTKRHDRISFYFLSSPAYHRHCLPHTAFASSTLVVRYIAPDT